MVFAGREELMVGRVDGETARTGAGGKLPGSCNASRCCVDTSDCAQRGQSYEDGTISVCYGRARAARERDGCGNLVGCRVDDGCAVAARVEDEDRFGDRVEDDGVGHCTCAY